jgi:hypothetical protein
LLQDGADWLDVAGPRPETVSTVTKRGYPKWMRDDLRMSFRAAKTASLMQISESDRGPALISCATLLPAICGILVKCSGLRTMPKGIRKKATTRTLKELWAKVANESLERTGDKGRAIREANAVVARQAGSE